MCWACSTRTRVSWRFPAANACRADSRRRQARKARRIKGSKSAPQREQRRVPRKRAWQTGQRIGRLLLAFHKKQQLFQRTGGFREGSGVARGQALLNRFVEGNRFFPVFGMHATEQAPRTLQ